MNADEIVQVLRDTSHCCCTRLRLMQPPTSNLTASQRRERAEKFFAMLNHRRMCGFTNNDETIQMIAYCDWRGPQEAGDQNKE